MPNPAPDRTTQTAVRVSVNSILVNVGLSVFKAVAGVLAHSGAMLSDAVHSLSDVLSTLVVIAGVKLAGKEADEKHQYGHERMESVAALLLAILLAATGAGIGYSGIQKLVAGNTAAIPVPGTLALVAAVASIAIKEGMYWYTRRAAKALRSDALMADAWHHRSDALSSIGSFVGILFARLGWPLFDPLASVVICLFILKAAVQIFIDAIRKMTDEACDEATHNAIGRLIRTQPGVLGLGVLQTRRFGNRLFVDATIEADGTLPLQAAHAIAEAVHDAVENAFPDVKHCMVHVDPWEEKPQST